MQPLQRQSKILLGFIFLWLWGLSWVRGLSVPDEGRYGDISRWMVTSGDWLVPRINGIPFLHKPPLLHWLSGLSLELFGMHIWVLRLVPVLMACVLLLAVFYFVRKHAQERVAQISVMVLSTSLLFFGASQYINHDLMLATWISLTIFCFADFSMNGKKSILLLGYACCAAAFLTKGLIGVLLPGLVILPWLLYYRMWHRIPAILNPFGIGLFLLLVSPWLWLMQQKYPDFLHYFFIDQQFNRFHSEEFNNKHPWPYYALILLLSFLPWLLSSAFRLRLAVARQLFKVPMVGLMLWWTVSISVFFSIPPSKLAGYILPVVAPLAILLACGLYQLQQQDCFNRLQRWGTPIFVLIFAIVIITLPLFQTDLADLYATHAMTLYGISFALILLIALLSLHFYQAKIQLLSFHYCCLILLCSSIPFWMTALDQKSNATQIDFVQKIPAQAHLVFYHAYFYDVPTLLNRKQPVYVVDNWQAAIHDNYAQELSDGLKFEPQSRRYLWAEAQLQQQLAQRSSTDTWVVMSRPQAYQPSVKPQQVWHYRNFDLFVFQGAHPQTTQVK